MALDLLSHEVAELPRRRRASHLSPIGRALAWGAAAFTLLALIGALHVGR